MVFRLRERDTGGHQRITYIARFLVGEYGIVEVSTQLIIQTQNNSTTPLMHLQSSVTLAKSTTAALHETNTRRSICSDWLIRILIHSSRRMLRLSDSMFTVPRMAAQRDKIVIAEWTDHTSEQNQQKPRTNHSLRPPKAAPHWLIQRRSQSKHKRTFRPRTCTKRVRSAPCPNNNNNNNNNNIGTQNAVFYKNNEIFLCMTDNFSLFGLSYLPVFLYLLMHRLQHQWSSTIF